MISRRAALLVSLGLALPGRAAARASDDLPVPPLYTPALARKLEPALFPFAAEYAKGSRSLLFVAARHEIGQETRTAQLIRQKVASFRPRLIIIEGLAAEGGRNPPDLLKRLRGENGITAEPTAGENRVAAEVALRNGVAFQGGEPSTATVFAELIAGKFERNDVLFADLMKVMPSLVRSGQIASAGDPRFATIYPGVAEQLARGVGAAPMTLETFKSKYMQIFHADPETDELFVRRSGPDDTNVVARILQAQGQIRDRALLRLIREDLDQEGRVLVVYGGSHWTTLSALLASLLGPPSFDLYLARPPSPG
jgi:hypothetical protein